MVGFQTIFQQLQTPEVWSRHCGSLRSIWRENTLFLVRCNNDKTVGILIIQSWRFFASAKKNKSGPRFQKVSERNIPWLERTILVGVGGIYFSETMIGPETRMLGNEYGKTFLYAMDPPRYASPKEQPTNPAPTIF